MRAARLQDALERLTVAIRDVESELAVFWFGSLVPLRPNPTRESTASPPP